MAYFNDLFSPETHAAFSRSDMTVSGFRVRQRAAASRVEVGDKLVCYLTKLSRWVGVLEVLDGPFESSAPVFTEKDDPFVVRFHVKPLVWLPPEAGIPIHDDAIWNHLSFTKDLVKGSSQWTGQVRGSLNKLKPGDGEFLERVLLAQGTDTKAYPLDDADKKHLDSLQVRRPEGGVAIVSVPEAHESDDASGDTLESAPARVRESIQIQALLGQVGAAMDLKIWVPAGDRARVLAEWPEGAPFLATQLPMSYDDTTMKTIANIDVLWLKGRSIVRAFEVEHTTAVYSGILRMADLLALQPNMDIRLHIVAPEDRKQKVLQEIRRPVFALLERAPLAECCTFLSYDAVREVAENEHLPHLSHTVLEEYEERADEH